ncbi:hypothetical protein [Plantactinospora sp. WMMB782]|uniref:hypothetical protein n=1 Tax=Plantactinospora sp. WMMB782 TaxID=3404121 RepID=UPI003B92A970
MAADDLPPSYRAARLIIMAGSGLLLLAGVAGAVAVEIPQTLLGGIEEVRAWTQGVLGIFN